MSKCPDYYITSDGREFWQFYRDECVPTILEYYPMELSQVHALQSACEYLFRAGRKSHETQAQDVAKAYSLIQRMRAISTNEDQKNTVESVVAETIGKVILERFRVEFDQTTCKPDDDYADPIRTAWGTVNHE